jgi:NADH:ubiquinone oxidoreductase subunit C
MKAGLGRAKGRLITIIALREGDTYRLIYPFDTGGEIAKVEVRVPVKKPVADSIKSKYPYAELYEREIYEQFGIEFRGHPNPAPLFILPEDRFPMRDVK